MTPVTSKSNAFGILFSKGKGTRAKDDSGMYNPDIEVTVITETNEKETDSISSGKSLTLEGREHRIETTCSGGVTGVSMKTSDA